MSTQKSQRVLAAIKEILLSLDSKEASAEQRGVQKGLKIAKDAMRVYSRDRDHRSPSDVITDLMEGS